jgi:hypothetical protein
MGKKVNPYKFYIVNITNIRKLFYYNTPYNSENEAKAAIDTYLQPGLELIIKRGDLVIMEEIPKGRKKIPMHSPAAYRDKTKQVTANAKKERERIIGKGLKTYLFKDPLKAREDYKKGRDRIRNKILKW